MIDWLVVVLRSEIKEIGSSSIEAVSSGNKLSSLFAASSSRAVLDAFVHRTAAT